MGIDCQQNRAKGQSTRSHYRAHDLGDTQKVSDSLQAVKAVCVIVYPSVEAHTLA